MKCCVTQRVLPMCGTIRKKTSLVRNGLRTTMLKLLYWLLKSFGLKTLTEHSKNYHQELSRRWKSATNLLRLVLTDSLTRSLSLLKSSNVWKSSTSLLLMSTPEMWSRISWAWGSMRLNHSPGNLSWSSNGLLIKIMMCHQGNSADSLGRTTILSSNASLRLLIGLDSTLTST